MLGGFFISADHTNAATFLANVNRGSICFFVFYRRAISAVHTRLLSRGGTATHDKQNKKQTQQNSAKRFPHFPQLPYSFAPHSVQNAASPSTLVPQLGQTLSSDSASLPTGLVSEPAGVPQLVQKFIPSWIMAPQFLHGIPFWRTAASILGIGAPQELQNADPAATSAPHFSQRWTPLIS